MKDTAALLALLETSGTLPSNEFITHAIGIFPGLYEDDYSESGKQLRNQQTQQLIQYAKEHEKEYKRSGLTNVFDAISEYFNPEQAGNFKDFYDNLAPEEFWRLFIDVEKQRDPNEKGYIGYEKREPGFLQAMFEAFQYCETHIQAPLTPQLICELHKRAASVCQIETTIGNGWSIEIVKRPIEAGKFKASKMGNITLGNSWISPLGFQEVTQSFEDLYLNQYNMLVVHPIFPAGGYESKIAEMITEYEVKVTDSPPLSKLHAIVRFIQDLERLHAFDDGNTRTCITLLMNRELVRHGFSPSLLEDPNRFDGFTHDECVAEVIDGMKNFKFLCDNGCLPGCRSTAELVAEHGPAPLKRDHLAQAPVYRL